VGHHRTAWHLPFVALIAERAPPGFVVQIEERLGREPQRADLLLRRVAKQMPQRARVLRRLWAWLGMDTIAEFKSLARPFRRGDLLRLWGYGAQYHARHVQRLRPEDLTLVLIVPQMTRTLREEVAWLKCSMEDLGGGYRRVQGAVYFVYIVIIDAVAESERDAFLALFGNQPMDHDEARWWMEQFMMQDKTRIERLEGHDAMVSRLLDMATAKQRLMGLTAQQRLDGLAPEQILLALPEQVLRGLSSEYLSTLPPALSRRIRRRTEKLSATPPATGSRKAKKPR
jgi:hypothetical protein